MIVQDDLPATELDRAEGQRYLLQRLSASIGEVLDRESGPPVVELHSHKLGKYGMVSADAKYSTVRVAADGTYSLHGILGTTHHIAFQLVTNRESYQAFDSISGEDIPVDGSGPFEVLISAVKPEAGRGAWLRLDPRRHAAREPGGPTGRDSHATPTCGAALGAVTARTTR